MYGYFKIEISEKKMAKLMYAILMTKSKIINCHHLGLERFTRKQNSRHRVNVVVDVEDEKVKDFEKLAEVKLKTSEEFQGKMILNQNK